jgi:hypothetical protein
MNKKITLLILSFYAISVFAQSIELKKIDIYSEVELGTFLPSYQQPIFKYFSQLQNEKVISDVYILKPNLGMNMSPFGGLNILPEQPMKCDIVVCKDTELQIKLNKELKNGRLILITHPWGGANGTTFEPNKLLQPFFENLGLEKDEKKSIIAFSPNLTLDVLHHELNHDHDYLNPEVQSKISQIREIMFAKDLKANKVVESYIYEARAYTAQSEYLKSHVRDIEFYFDDEKMQTLNREGKEYLEDTLMLNESKKRMYKDRLERALLSKVFTRDEADKIRKIIEEALSLPLLE